MKNNYFFSTGKPVPYTQYTPKRKSYCVTFFCNAAQLKALWQTFEKGENTLGSKTLFLYRAGSFEVGHKIVEIEHFALWVAILSKCQICLGGRGQHT